MPVVLHANVLMRNTVISSSIWFSFFN